MWVGSVCVDLALCVVFLLHVCTIHEQWDINYHDNALFVLAGTVIQLAIVSLLTFTSSILVAIYYVGEEIQQCRRVK